MTTSPRYIVEKRDTRRFAVIDTHRSSHLRVLNEYNLRRDAQAYADFLERRRTRTTPAVDGTGTEGAA